MERKIGERFFVGNDQLKVVADTDGTWCQRCYFKTPEGRCFRDLQIAGMCQALFRSDKTEVRFELVE